MIWLLRISEMIHTSLSVIASRRSHGFLEVSNIDQQGARHGSILNASPPHTQRSMTESSVTLPPNAGKALCLNIGL